MDAALSSPDMKRIALREIVARRGASTYTGELDLGFVGGMTLRAEVDTEHARAVDLIGVAADLPGVDGDVSGHIALAGPFERLQGEVDLRFDAAEIAGEHLDGGEAHARMVDGELLLDRLRLTREAGSEGLDVRGRVGLGYALDLDVVADGLRLESLDNLRAWLPPQPDLRAATWSGAVAAWARVGGTLQSPAPHGRVWVTDVRWQGTDLADSLVDFSTTEGDLHFHAELLGGDIASYGALDLVDDHHLELTAVVDDLRLDQLAIQAADGAIVGGALSGALQLQGDVGPGQAGLTDLHGRVDELTLRWGGQTLTNPAPWVADFHDGRVVVEDFALRGDGTAIAFDLATGPTDLDLRGGGKLDLSLLRAVVPGLTRSEGSALIDVVAATPPQGGAPRTTLTAAVEGGLIEHGSVPLLLEDLTARLRADRDGVRIDALHASAGGGTLDVEGGVRSDGWTPERLDLHAAVQGAEVQWIPELPPAIGDAQISLTGPVGALLLRGDVDVRSMEFTERIDWEDSVVAFRGDVATDGTRPGVERWFDIDLGIHAPGTLRFDNNLAEGTGSAELRVVGDTSRPGLVGAARIDSGDAFLQDHRFEIQRGLVEFLDPWSWDPELDIHLETSVPTRNRTYDVRYDIQGPYSAWQIEASSDAGLSPGDVNALLWFGATPDELAAQGDPQAVAGALAGDLAQLLLADLFASTGASELRDNLAFVDRVEFITGIDARGDWSFDPQVQISKRFRRFGDLELLGEFNLVRSDDQLFRLQRRFGAAWTLGLWYATLDRRTILPTSVDGAFGLDVTLHWESR
jgi:autotransporter translocation and assembly factor TamB